ncbi:MAG: hypothetical protein S0880_23360 [Actinomycetota bacterium]|nr:hypothetical protein [Actinomycetota bacterium]
MNERHDIDHHDNDEREPDDELRRLAAELPGLRLRPSAWAEVAAALDRIEAGEREAVSRLSRVSFEARIDGRLGGGRRAPGVVPTKQTSALPWVGLVCGLLVAGVGGALGGGPVLLAAVVLAVAVFLVAFAGSRVAHRSDRKGPAPDEVPEAPPVPIPDDLATRLRRHT